MSRAVSTRCHVIEGVGVPGGLTGRSGGFGAGHPASNTARSQRITASSHGTLLEHERTMRVALVFVLAGCLTSRAASQQGPDGPDRTELCQDPPCGGSGEALPLSLIGIAVLLGVSVWRELR